MRKILVGQPRAQGRVNLSVAHGPRGTELANLRHEGSLRAMFPRSEGAGLPVVLTNTAGGVTGGDRFCVEATAEEGAFLTITTQAAERAYRAQPGEKGRIDTHLLVKAEARVNWLPQETILYQGSALDRKLTVDLDSGSSALIVEPLVFGRAAMGEVLTSAFFADRIDIRRSGQCVFLDRMILDGDIAARLARPAVGDGAGAVVIIAFVHHAAEAMLAPVRALLPETGGASLVRPDVLVVRILAADSFGLRQSLVPAIRLLNNDDLPRPWMI